MPTNPSPTANLPCEQCGYLNEPERVYCHNCGAKLDRSLLPKVEEKKLEKPEQARKRIEKMTNPQSGWIMREIFMIFKTAFWGAVVAILILLFRAPDDVPETKKGGSDRLISSDMMEALESPAPRPLSFSEDDVNQYLKQMLKPKPGSYGVEFSRAFVRLRPGEMRITSENSVWGFPMYAAADFNLEVKDGKFQATIVGGHFGRLSIDPQLMRYSDAIFGDLWGSLKRERGQMDKMASVKIEDKRIDLVTKGAAAMAAPAPAPR